MKYLLILLTLLTTLVKAEVIDPNITATKLFTCTMPIARTDGTVLDVGEIAEVRFYVAPDKEPLVWAQTGTNTLCSMLYTLTDVPDGIYFYTADVVDTEGRESIKALEVATLEVKRLANPVPPSGLGWH